MSALGITYVDPIVVAVIVMSAIYATYRGFVSETLSIFAWAAAAFATLFFGPKIAPYARGWLSPPFLGQLAGYAAIFLAVLIPLSFVSFRFAESVKHSQVGTLDRSLGTVFGIVRGLAIVGLAYIAFTFVVLVSHQPSWLLDAKTLPIIRGSAQVLLSLVPDQHLGTANAELVQPEQPEPKNAAIPTPQPKPATASASKKRGQKAYGAQERQQLDRLIETTGGNGNP
jgi:membrane protein required for colicin V production